MLTASTKPQGVVRFNGLEFNLGSGELCRDGIPLKLQPQPAKVLALLVSRPGEVVARNQLAEQVWGSDTFVDFEQGLNFAIRQIRTVLGDDAEHPRFLETVPKRGYRFIAPVESASPIVPTKSAPRNWLRVAAVVVIAGLLGLAAYVVRRAARPAAQPRAIVLAVLPFDDLSSKPEEYLVDGLTEEMISQLTRISPDLKVIARTSAMQYLRTKKSAREIGQELGADYILENSIRHEAGRLRITAQLVRSADQTHLWAENYDRDMRELLPLESEVTQDIAEQIRRHLLPAAVVSHPAGARSVDPVAHELYLKGRYFFNQRSQEGLERSVQYFTQAVAKDPSYAAAYAGLADAYNLFAFYGFDPSQNAVTQAKLAADKAVQLDDSLAAAHAALAYTQFMFAGDWQAADHEFRRALDLDDNYVPVHQWYALYLAGNGHVDEAIGQMQYAQRLDPLSPAVHAGLGYMYYFSRDYEQAVQQAQVAQQLNPNFMAAHAVMGWAYTQQHKYPEAIAELQTAAKLSGGNTVYLCGLGRAQALSGDLPEAKKITLQAEAASVEPHGSGTALAGLYLAMGDSDHALRWLEQTAPGDIQANWLRVEPAFDSLRTNPRFTAIVSRVGGSKQ